MGRKPTKNMNLPRGMRARKQRSGNVFYYYDAGGTPRREIPLGSDYVQAVKKWAELEADKGSPHVQLITFKYVSDRYTREVIPTKAVRTQADNIIELNKLLEFFSDAPLIDIKPIFVRQYLDWRHAEAKKRVIEENVQRVKDGKPPKAVTGSEGKVRANREKALFSHVWNKAREWGLTDAPNPCMGIKGFTETGRKNIYIEDEVFASVHRSASQPLRDAMDLAYLTGQRPSDILKMKESDLREGVLYLTQDKTATKLRMSIEGELHALVNRIMTRKAGRKVRSLYLIVDEKGQRFTYNMLREHFDVARAAAGIEKKNFQFRDLRAKAATDKTESTDIRQAQKQLGHTTVTMTEHYVRGRRGEKVSPTK